MTSRRTVELRSSPESKPAEPPWLTLARAELGVKEDPGPGSDARVLRYYADAGHPGVKDDTTAWCAAFVGSILYRSGIQPSGSLLAASYASWGRPLPVPALGAVATVAFAGAKVTHVGFVVEEGAGFVRILGGNQSDAVTIMRVAGASVRCRWPAGEGVPAPRPFRAHRAPAIVARPPRYSA